MIDKKPFEQLLEQLKDDGKYRVFNDILRERGEYPKAIWYGKYNIKNIVNWCSNDYLGMGQHKVVTDAMHTALDQTGAGSGGTRNIAGTSHYHVALEHELAQLHSKESALLYTLPMWQMNGLWFRLNESFPTLCTYLIVRIMQALYKGFVTVVLKNIFSRTMILKL